MGAFSCGGEPDYENLNKYIQKYALINQENGYGRTWILHEEGSNEVDGYYTVCNSTAEKKSWPIETVRNLPNYPRPCTLLARLAVAEAKQRCGLGEILLFDALKRAKKASRDVGSSVVIVDAINEKAVQFYLKYSFKKFDYKPMSLYLTMTEIVDDDEGIQLSATN